MPLSPIEPASHYAVHANNDHSTPLAGAVICCTSVPDEKRTSLASYAEQMGAAHRHPLTLDTTHLVVGDYNSAKYRYVARERPDIRPMSAEWIEAIRHLWMNDQAIDMGELERVHTLPTLHSLRLSMTGCDDATERNHIADQIRANGGSYEGDLTKQITHLISFRTEGAKYKAARNWGLKVVSIEWLQDSLERGMILNEELYDPVIPPLERGLGAWDRTKTRRVSLGKRQREDSMMTEGGKRKLRRSASNKLTSQNSQIWGEIVSGGSAIQVERSGQWESDPDTNPEGAVVETKINGQHDQTVEKAKKTGIFAGHHFYYYGFSTAESEILQHHLLSHDAQIHETVDEFISAPPQMPHSQFLVMVPHDVPKSQLKPIRSPKHHIRIVTVWWLERCLYKKKFLNPHDHVIGQPFKQFPISGFEQLSISTSGFGGIDFLHVTKAIKLLGAQYGEDMTARSSVLVVESWRQLRKDKLAFAQEWKIPIVSSDWLWNSIEKCQRLPFQPYVIRSKNAPVNHTESRSIQPAVVIDEAGQTSELEKNVTTTIVSKIPLKEAPDASIPKDIKDPVPKQEPNENDAPAMTEGTNSTTQENTRRSEPLAEISNNVASAAPTPAETLSSAPPPQPKQEYDTTAISNLLNRQKTAAAASTGPQDAPWTSSRRKKRILGRAASTTSNGSAHSRATSVDPSGSNHPGPSSIVPDEEEEGDETRVSNERIESLLSGRHAQDEETQLPPLTQLRYDDPDSRAAEEMIRAKMSGKEINPRKKIERTKTLTVHEADALGAGTEQVGARTRRSKR